LENIQENNKAIVRKFNKEFVEEKNISVFEEIVSPDFYNHDVPDPSMAAAFFFFTKIFHGAFPDAKVIVHDQFADGDTVITRKSYKGTHKGDFLGIPGSNKAVTIPVIEIIKLRDGKYVEHWANADIFGLLQQIKAD